MKIIFITDIHQNLEAVKKLDFTQFDMILCGGDIIDPANINLEIAKEIIDLLPARTIFVPGNVDKDENLLKMTEKFNNIDFKKITVSQNGIDIDLVGLGKARSLADDFVEYRRYFEADHKRIYDFAANSPAKFILRSCGIDIQDDKINFVDMDKCLQDAQGFVTRFAAFDENDAQKFFDSIDSLNNGIFVCHSPIRDALDKLPYLPPIGAVAARQAVERLKPRLVLCGHFHENGGLTKVGETTVFNPGAVKDGCYGVIDFNGHDFECKTVKI